MIETDQTLVIIGLSYSLLNYIKYDKVIYVKLQLCPVTRRMRPLKIRLCHASGNTGVKAVKMSPPKTEWQVHIEWFDLCFCKLSVFVDVYKDLADLDF